MTQNLFRWAAGAIGAAATLLATSCAYDPSYSAGGSYGGGGYSDNYGDGYGYGSSSFSTSIFVGTGDPRWGYDPYTYSYYDYYRHSYYDPYLYGYYPVGYRPRPVYGVPHPGGWRPGRGYCPPPSRVTVRNLSNYRNRESAYRGSNYSWANQVRNRDSGSPSRAGGVRQGPGQSQGFDRSRGNDSGRPQWNNNNNNNAGPQRGDSAVRYGNDSRSSSTRSAADFNRDRSARPEFARPAGQVENATRPQRQPNFAPQSQQNGGRRPSPSGYNSPVGVNPQRAAASQQQPRFNPQQGRPQGQPQSRQAPPSSSGGGGGRRGGSPATQSNGNGGGGGDDGRRGR
jgi:hypothetical protein